MKLRANGEETINGLPPLDAFFNFSTENPGPSVGRILLMSHGPDVLSGIVERAMILNGR